MGTLTEWPSRVSQTVPVSDEQQQRLERIVGWMQTFADPWMREEQHGHPEPGSDLAVDDAHRPPSSALAHYGISMALDHLGSVVDAVVSDQPMRHKAHFTTLRTVLECGARVRWLLDPDDSTQRRLRAVRYRWENLDEQRKAIKDLAGTHIVGEQEQARQQALAGMEAEEAALTARATELGADKLTKPPSTYDLLKGMVDINTYEGMGVIQLWRQGSASVHGHFWADQYRDNPGEFDFQWFYQALYGAMLFVNEAMTLHHRRSTTA